MLLLRCSTVFEEEAIKATASAPLLFLRMAATSSIFGIFSADIRVELDDSPEKIGAKIRTATLDKIPYMAVVGQREAESGAVAVRHRTEGDKGAVSVAEFVAMLRSQIESKSAAAGAQKTT